MFGLIWGVTARAHYAVRRFMPTNVVLDAIHTRRGLKWGVPAMLLAVPYAFAAALCVGLVEVNGSGWLNVVALLFVWNALKFLVAGPVTLMRLLRVRGREAREQRRATRAVILESPGSERSESPALSSRSSARVGPLRLSGFEGMSTRCGLDTPRGRSRVGAAVGKSRTGIWVWASAVEAADGSAVGRSG